MALKCGVIGLGAAGNKAAIALIESGVCTQTDVILLNSTLKDVPDQYKEIALEFEGDSKGCAKERKLAQSLMLSNLKSQSLGIDEFVANKYDFVLICASAEGGTGSGSSTILAKYINQVLHVPVHLTVFGGFHNDSRGLKNTVDWFKETSTEYIVDSVCNSAFLEESNQNERKAEVAANMEFVERVKILLGRRLIDSTNNIDDVDLLKLVTTPGYQIMVHGDLGKPKNIDDFNKTVKGLIDNAKGFATVPSAVRIGVVLNISDKVADNIDYSFKVIKDAYGEPFELFTHVQNVEAEGNYIQIIASGCKMPMEEIQEIYDDFMERKAKVDVSQDSFFDTKFETEADEFDMARGRTNMAQISKDRDAFFGTPAPAKPSNSGKFNHMKKMIDEM